MGIRAAVTDPSSPLWIFLIIMNIICWAAMGIDKYKAQNRKRRIPEKTLFLLALLGGSAGGVIGMYFFRHKTLHRKFAVGFPLILVAQCVLLFCLGCGA